MKEALRKTGVNIMERCRGASTFAYFMRPNRITKNLGAYISRRVAENNELCIWVVSEPLNEGEVIEAMRRTIPKFNQYLEKGQIEVLSGAEWYLKEGEFNGHGVLNGLVARLDLTSAKGYEGLRGAGCVVWGKEDWKKVVDYEEELKEVIGRNPMMTICAYPIDQCGVSKVIDLAVNHRFISL